VSERSRQTARLIRTGMRCMSWARGVAVTGPARSVGVSHEAGEGRTGVSTGFQSECESLVPCCLFAWGRVGSLHHAVSVESQSIVAVISID
jgi:hypothetical protein